MKIKNNELKEMVAIANTTKTDYSTAIEVKKNELLVQFNVNYLYSLKGEHSMELGSYYLSAMEFNKIIKSLPSGESDVRIEDEKLILSDKAGDIETPLDTANEIFIPNIDETLAKIKTEEFIEVLKECKPFTSKDTNRLVFCGVYLDYYHQDHILKVVALDGYRMYIRDIQLDEATSVDYDFSFILNAETVEKIKKIKSSEFIEIKAGTSPVDEKQYFITFENGILEDISTKGDYFSYKELLKNDINYEAEYDWETIKELTQYFEKCKKLSGKENLIESTIINHEHIIQTIGAGTKVKKTLKSDTQDRFKIAYNGDYMIDMLKLFKDSGRVTVKMEDHVNPIMMEDDVRFALLLPVRLAK